MSWDSGHNPGGITDLDALDCLNSWPAGTVGEHEERIAIRALNLLCQKYGYGRIPQLAKQIEDLWREGPERVQHYRDWQEERRKMMADIESAVDELAEQSDAGDE